MILDDATLDTIRRAATPGEAAGLWWAAQVHRGPGADSLDISKKDLDCLVQVIQVEIDGLVEANLVPYEGVNLEMDYKEKGLLAELKDRAKLPVHLVFDVKMDMWIRPFEITVRAASREPIQVLWRRRE